MIAAGLRRLPRRLDVRDAAARGRNVPRRGLGVELGVIGGDAVVALPEDDVAARDDAVLVFEELDLVGVELRVALLELDRARQQPVVLAEPFLTVCG